MNGSDLLSRVSEQEWQERVTSAILFCFFGSGGILLNALPILLTLCTEMRHNKVNVMVANLSMADLLFSTSFVFGQIQYLLYREQLNPVGCQWLAFLTFTTAFFEFIFPPFLAVNRYICLYHSERYDGIYTAKKIVAMILGSWTFCTIIPLIFTLCGKTGFDDDNQHCCIIVKTSPIGWTIFYWMVIIVPLVTFSDGTMLFCNYKIYKKLSSHTAVQTLKQNVVRQNRELLYFLVADMTFPILFHTTYHVAKFVSYNRVDLVQKRVFSCLYLINSCVRGLITMTTLRPYRQALKNVTKTICCRGGSNMVGPMASNGIGKSSMAVTSRQVATAAPH